MQTVFRLMNERDAAIILGWRYEEPLSVYNPSQDDLIWMLDPDNYYHSVIDKTGTIIAFFCLGSEACVRGGDYSQESALDVGMGLRPDLIGNGLGKLLLPTILRFAYRQFTPPRFRATVATFNERALHMTKQVGFQPVRLFTGKTPRGIYEFVQMVKAVE